MYLNGRLVSGSAYLPQGFTQISTSESNYIDVDENLLTAADLEREDPLYPYNHKYLIDGYPYADSFSGDQVYQGLDEHFAKLLSYRSPEEFAYLNLATVITMMFSRLKKAMVTGTLRLKSIRLIPLGKKSKLVQAGLFSQVLQISFM